MKNTKLINDITRLQDLMGLSSHTTLFESSSPPSWIVRLLSTSPTLFAKFDKIIAKIKRSGNITTKELNNVIDEFVSERLITSFEANKLKNAFAKDAELVRLLNSSDDYLEALSRKTTNTEGILELLGKTSTLSDDVVEDISRKTVNKLLKNKSSNLSKDVSDAITWVNNQIKVASDNLSAGNVINSEEDLFNYLTSKIANEYDKAVTAKNLTMDEAEAIFNDICVKLKNDTEYMNLIDKLKSEGKLLDNTPITTKPSVAPSMRNPSDIVLPKPDNSSFFNVSRTINGTVETLDSGYSSAYTNLKKLPDNSLTAADREFINSVENWKNSGGSYDYVVVSYERLSLSIDNAIDEAPTPTTFITTDAARITWLEKVFFRPGAQLDGFFKSIFDVISGVVNIKNTWSDSTFFVKEAQETLERLTSLQSDLNKLKPGDPNFIPITNDILTLSTKLRYQMRMSATAKEGLISVWEKVKVEIREYGKARNMDGYEVDELIRKIENGKNPEGSLKEFIDLGGSINTSNLSGQWALIEKEFEKLTESLAENYKRYQEGAQKIRTWLGGGNNIGSYLFSNIVQSIKTVGVFYLKNALSFLTFGIPNMAKMVTKIIRGNGRMTGVSGILKVMKAYIISTIYIHAIEPVISFCTDLLLTIPEMWGVEVFTPEVKGGIWANFWYDFKKIFSVAEKTYWYPFLNPIGGENLPLGGLDLYDDQTGVGFKPAPFVDIVAAWIGRLANFEGTDDQRQKNKEKIQKELDIRIKELIESLPEDRYKEITKPHEELKVTFRDDYGSFYGLTSEELKVLSSHIYSEVFTDINIDQGTQDNLKTKNDKQFGEYFAKLDPKYLVASRICENKPNIVGNRLKCKGKSWRMVQNNDKYISIPNPETGQPYNGYQDAPVTDYIYNIPNYSSKIYYLPNNNQDTKTKVDPGIEYQNLKPINKDFIDSLK